MTLASTIRSMAIGPAAAQERANRRALTPTGALRFQEVSGRTAITRCYSPEPIKLLTPKRDGQAAWVYMSTYGGGLVAGDRVDVQVDVCPGAIGVLTTQASTKVYHQRDGRGSSQHLDARVSAGGTLVVAPDPVTCFADARYEQRQSFELDTGASLLLLDWFTAGRLAMGERWVFDRYHTENRVSIDGTCIACDRMRMNRNTHALDSHYTTGRYNCFATVMLIGPAFERAVEALDEEIQALPLPQRSPMPISFGRFAWGGILRLAGTRVEHVQDEIASRLAFIEPVIGGGLWHRKW